MKLYLDVSDGTIVDYNEFGEVPILKGQEGVYVETWWVDREYNLVLDFAYTQLEQDLGIVHVARRKHFENNYVYPLEMKCITIPTSKYEEAESRFNRQRIAQKELERLKEKK